MDIPVGLSIPTASQTRPVRPEALGRRSRARPAPSGRPLVHPRCQRTSSAARILASLCVRAATVSHLLHLNASSRTIPGELARVTKWSVVGALVRHCRGRALSAFGMHGALVATRRAHFGHAQLLAAVRRALAENFEPVHEERDVVRPPAAGSGSTHDMFRCETAKHAWAWTYHL